MNSSTTVTSSSITSELGDAAFSTLPLNIVSLRDRAIAISLVPAESCCLIHIVGERLDCADLSQVNAQKGFAGNACVGAVEPFCGFLKPVLTPVTRRSGTAYSRP